MREKRNRKPKRNVRPELRRRHSSGLLRHSVWLLIRPRYDLARVSLLEAVISSVRTVLLLLCLGVEKDGLYHLRVRVFCFRRWLGSARGAVWRPAFGLENEKELSSNLADSMRSFFKINKKKQYTSDGFTIESLTGYWAKKIKKNYFLFNDAVRVTPGNYILPRGYRKWHEKYQNFEVKPTDVWVISFPKAGTTWTQEMVWCIMNNLDYESAQTVLTKRFPYFEYEGLIPRNLVWMMPSLDKGDPNLPGESWKLLNSMSDPRTIKSHLHKNLMPKGMWSVKPKIVYVCRDPRDVCVSFYYHSIRYNGFKGDFSSFVELFLADMLLMFTPYWKHVLDYWSLRNEENIYFIRYEELKEDLSGMIKKVSEFLGKQLTKEQVESLGNHLSFENMKTNKAVNNDSLLIFPHRKAKKIQFMRKGMVGDWRSHLTKEQIIAFKDWTDRNLIDSDFPYYRDYSILS